MRSRLTRLSRICTIKRIIEVLPALSTYFCITRSSPSFPPCVFRLQQPSVKPSSAKQPRAEKQQLLLTILFFFFFFLTFFTFSSFFSPSWPRAQPLFWKKFYRPLLPALLRSQATPPEQTTSTVTSPHPDSRPTSGSAPRQPVRLPIQRPAFWILVGAYAPSLFTNNLLNPDTMIIQVHTWW